MLTLFRPGSAQVSAITIELSHSYDVRYLIVNVVLKFILLKIKFLSSQSQILREREAQDTEMVVGEEEVLHEIVKARTDKREYRRVILRNSLKVLIISDPDTDKCATSMDVRVGYFSDPEGLKGLTHFLEHMLFYASEKYSLEDSYRKYITEHGGRTNAFTSSVHTNYFFFVNCDGFEEALDRFAQFFNKPLMKADATMREIKAVDSASKTSEFAGSSISQITGNWDTLEVRPKAKGLETKLELIKFYEENYSANLMYLVIYAKEDLDKIQGLVEEKFQEIRNIDRNSFYFPS